MSDGHSLIKQLDLAKYDSAEQGAADVCEKVEAHLKAFFPVEDYEYFVSADHHRIRVRRGHFVGKIDLRVKKDMMLEDGEWVPSTALSIKATRKHKELSKALDERTQINNEDYPALFRTRKSQMLYDIYRGFRLMFAGRKVEDAFDESEDDAAFQESDGRWHAFLAGLEEKLGEEATKCGEWSMESGKTKIDGQQITHNED